VLDFIPVGTIKMKNEKAIERVREMITDISQVCCEQKELLNMGTPWKSTNPGILKLWDKLTDPGNLADLEIWASRHDDYNPTARRFSEQALARCKERAA
jgi:hypothetical protein